LRGDPKNRPPFPAQKGYLGRPTAVDNVETFCCAARIMDHGPAWFAGFGNEKSTGTKVLSISGIARTLEYMKFHSAFRSINCWIRQGLRMQLPFKLAALLV